MLTSGTKSPPAESTKPIVNYQISNTSRADNPAILQRYDASLFDCSETIFNYVLNEQTDQYLKAAVNIDIFDSKPRNILQMKTDSR